MALSEVSSLTALGQLLYLGFAGILVGIMVALAASGTYALMSFTVTERTREIGVRTALGAQRSSIVFTIARRALAQLGIGIFLGAPLAWTIIWAMQSSIGATSAQSPLVLTLIVGASVMVVIGSLACTAPTLRALRIMPTEALREGG